MKKPDMGVDLDGVVYQFLEVYDKLLIDNGITPDKTLYNRGLSLEDTIKYLDKGKESMLLQDLPEYPGVVDKLKELSKKYNLHIITARTNTFDGYKNTIRNVKESGIPYESMAFVRNKGPLAYELGLSKFIEDSYENAVDIVNASPTTKVFLINTDYNQNENKHLRIIRVNSIEEIL